MTLPQKPAPILDDVILNPIRLPDRFGCGIKNEKLYYGVVIQTDDGKLHPSVFDGEWRFGEEQLKILGFSFAKDFSMAGETWERNRFYYFKQNPKKAMTTKELLDTFVNLNKKIVWHEKPEVHLIVAAYELASYIYPAFQQFPRAVFIGLASSGKSTQTDVMAALGLNPITSADASKSFLFRSVEVSAGMVLIDNFDNISEDAQKDMIQLYDTSFEQGRSVGRTDDTGRAKAPRKWNTYCPMVVNCTSLSWMRQQSSKTRTIFFRMLTKSDVKLIKLKKISKTEIEDIKHEFRVWALANWKRLGEIEIGGFENRELDIFKPILTILKDAGENYFEQGKNYLEQMANEFHMDEPDAFEGELIQAVWNLLDKNAEVCQLTPKEIATEIMQIREIEPRDEDGHQNKAYTRELGDLFRNKIPVAIKSIRIQKISRPNNRLHYHINTTDFAVFLNSRGYELGKEWREKLQAKLPSNPSNTPNPSNPSHSSNSSNISSIISSSTSETVLEGLDVLDAKEAMQGEKASKKKQKGGPSDV